MANMRLGRTVDLLAWRNGQALRMAVRF